MPGRLWHFVGAPSSAYAAHSVAYVVLCAASAAAAMLAGVVLGVAVARRPALAFVAVNLSGLMRAVPIIAFLAFAIPYLGLGFVPAFVALATLGIPPVLLNTYAGLRGIDPATTDAARGMGMTRWQTLRRVQGPLIMPVIAAGVRTSAVQIVATATLASIIGAGGYGDYIFSGLYQVDATQILAGAIPVTLLALLAEMSLAWAQRALTPAGLKNG